MDLFRVNQIDNYTNTMGGVDIEDQFRGTYKLYHWLRNQKWCWDIWYCSLGVYLVNSYIMYANLIVK